MSTAALELIDCERRKLRLTGAACARFWLASNPVPPPVWEGRVACNLCPAGAARAGAVVDVAQVVRDRLRHVCPRCRKWSDRIVNDRFCVSCYNRDLEIQRGRNRKGSMPWRVAGRLYPCRVTVIEGSTVEQVERASSAGVLELALWRARRAKAPLRFGWAPPVRRAA
jgi:hypothetical protein